MSFKLLASIRFLAFHDLDLVATPTFKITNHSGEKEKILDDDFRQFAGLRDLKSYEKNIIAYAVYESSNDDQKFQQEMSGEFNGLKEQVETFLVFLWFVKDSSISLEQAYGQFTIAKAVIWWTGRNVFSTCQGQFIETTYNTGEFNEAVQLLLSYTEHCIQEKQTSNEVKPVASALGQAGEFRPGIDPYKVENRIERAISFLSSARSTPHIPQKITHYMSILECLFSTDGSEIIHKVSERTAYYLEDNKADRLKIYKAVKEAYNVRSKFVHGDKPPKAHEQLCAISVRADEIIRRVLKKIILSDYAIFLQKDMNEYLTELTF